MAEHEGDGIDVMYGTDGHGRWWKTTWADQCEEDTGILGGRCQGVLGHEGRHWSYDGSGSFEYANRPDHPDYENHAEGGIPPDHADYIPPQAMYPHYYLKHWTREEITDPELIARLERNEVLAGESVTRPLPPGECEKLPRDPQG